MKRTDLIRHLVEHGCELLLEGGKHSLYANRAIRKSAPVPRHREIRKFVVRSICRALEVPEPEA